MKRILICVMSITFIVANSKTEDISFRYGLLSKSSYDSDSLIALSDSSIIHTGDLIRINIGYKNKTNFCIVYKDAEGGYMSLYSSDDEADLKQDTLYVYPLSWTQHQIHHNMPQSEITNPLSPQTHILINTTT